MTKRGKSQITNKFQHAAQAPALRVTEKTNNKQKNKKIVLALVCNLPARRLFGGVLGICNFRPKTLRQSIGL
jgi:hypothetical protein